jgi:hypothetical protein
MNCLDRHPDETPAVAVCPHCGAGLCSGLPVQRYGAEDLLGVLGEDFALASSSLATRRTRSGASQQFLYARLRRRSAD